MAEEQDKESRTEPATDKKRSEARTRGSVARSQDLSAAVIVTVGFVVLATFGTQICAGLMENMRETITGRMPRDLDMNGAVGLFHAAVERLAPVILLVTALFVAVAAAVNYWQVGFQVSLKAIEWKLSKLNPISGLKRIFKLRTLVRVLTAVVKTIIIVTAAYLPVKAELPQIALLDRSELGAILPFMGGVLSKAAIGACIALLFVGFADYFYQKWQFEKDLRMTKQEIKDEMKQSLGDPTVRKRIKRRQLETIVQRMMADVPKATVVVTNPTHYAVALRYVVGEDPAPKIVAKGKDLIAQKIKQIAKDSGVPIVENPPLAQGLFRGGEIGEEIPAALYRAVAELLSYVYRLRGKF